MTPSVVSPNGDGYADLPAVSYTLSARAAVTATLSLPGGAVVTTLFQDQMQGARRQRFPWPLDTVPDGRYTVTITARAEDGRVAVGGAAVTVARTLGFVAATPGVLSPDGDGVDDTVVFSFVLDRSAHVTIEVRREGVTLALVFVGELGPGRQAFLWDGTLPSGVAPPGRYQLVVTADGTGGTVSQDAAFEVASGPG